MTLNQDKTERERGQKYIFVYEYKMIKQTHDDKPGMPELNNNTRALLLREFM